MDKKKILAVTMTSALAVTALAGCKKDDPRLETVPNQGETLTTTQQTAATSDTTAQALAPVVSDTTQTSASETTSETTTTQPTETSETTTAVVETSETTVPVIATTSYISDAANVISDETSVNNAMAQFESSTGITPALFTIVDQLKGDEFREYARNIYSSNFQDQDHVLVVYQRKPDGTWNWTCVYGTNTFKCFNQDNIDQFTDELTSGFSSGNVDGTFISAFTNAEARSHQG